MPTRTGPWSSLAWALLAGVAMAPPAFAEDPCAAGVKQFCLDVPQNEVLTRSVVDGIHGVGYRIAVWTVNEPADIAAVWATGADVIQTDNPDFYGYVPK